ncbi:MAG: homoserine O-succinyltransferase [Clostridiales Family XIII bacterium]|jgi:homoserine O-succinyltransferase|nr:homoserine O-succinyltransferase [Clostridiales Family XIII bacterium]
MPILVQRGLPAYKTLKQENVFVMQDWRAAKQDIRPLSVAVVNLMPIKEITETQLIRLLANSPLQVQLELLTLSSHKFTHADPLHMDTFYRKFDEIKKQRLDAMIITGAPLETIPFEDVDYWEELKSIMDYSNANVFSTLHLCWGAQAGLYHHFGIEKRMLGKKIFGVFAHGLRDKKNDLTRGFDEEFYVPHSRWSDSPREQIEAEPALKILADSEEAGVHMVATKNKRQIFLQGHCEYDWNTLKLEYERDIARGADAGVPANYFKNDDPKRRVVVRWSGHANLFFSNWLNFVYQETPYNLGDLDSLKWRPATVKAEFPEDSDGNQTLENLGGLGI